ncbi:unnamed protein product, partial [Ostreobium quekettii]
GRSHSQDTLRLLNASGASAAMILPIGRTGAGAEVYQEARVDADVILTFKQLHAANPGLNICMDIQSASNLAFLMPHIEGGCDGGCGGLMSSPLFAAGMVCLSGFLDTLFCQAFYNSDIIRILRKILVGRDIADTVHVRVPDRAYHSALVQVPTPPGLAGRRFQSVFSQLLREGQVCVGIYRVGLNRGNQGPYVYTCPTKDAIVEVGQ